MERRPVKLTEPDVVFQLLRSIQAKSLIELALYALVDEVGGLVIPTFRRISLL